MRPVVPWRSRLAVWLLLPCLASVYAFQGLYLDMSAVRGYWPAVIAGSAIFLFFPCALAALSGAHEGARARRGRLDTLPHSRGGLAIVAVALWPSFACGLVVQLAAVLLLSRGTWGSVPSHPETLVLIAAALVAIIFFHAALGYLFGRVLPPAASLPVALLLSFSWLGFTWSVSWFPLRYLSGLILADCCSVDMQVDPRAPLAAIIFSIGVGALMIAASVFPRRVGPAHVAGRWSAWAVAATTVTTAGVFIASGLGYSAAVARPARDADCSGTHPAVCLFPEVGGSGHPEETIRHAVQNLEAAGLPVPATVRMGEDPRTAETLSMVVTVGMTDPQIIHSLAVSFLPLSGAVYCGTGADLQARESTYSTVGAWIVHAAANGIVDETQVMPVSAGEPGDPTALGRLAPARQAEWVRAAMPSLVDCSVPPPTVPAS